MAIWRTDVQEFGVFVSRDWHFFFVYACKRNTRFGDLVSFLRELQGVLFRLCLSVNEDCALCVSLHLGSLSLQSGRVAFLRKVKEFPNAIASIV